MRGLPCVVRLEAGGMFRVWVSMRGDGLEEAHLSDPHA